MKDIKLENSDTIEKILRDSYECLEEQRILVNSKTGIEYWKLADLNSALNMKFNAFHETIRRNINQGIKALEENEKH